MTIFYKCPNNAWNATVATSIFGEIEIKLSVGLLGSHLLTLWSELGSDYQAAKRANHYS